MKTKKISFSWEEKSSFDTERVGAMYCFKRNYSAKGHGGVSSLK